MRTLCHPVHKQRSYFGQDHTLLPFLPVRSPALQKENLPLPYHTSLLRIFSTFCFYCLFFLLIIFQVFQWSAADQDIQILSLDHFCRFFCICFPERWIRRSVIYTIGSSSSSPIFTSAVLPSFFTTTPWIAKGSVTH